MPFGKIRLVRARRGSWPERKSWNVSNYLELAAAYCEMARMYWARWKALASGANTQEVTGGATPGSLAGARRLNNLVSELLNLSQPKARSGQEWKFTNPQEGWVFRGVNSWPPQRLELELP